MYIDQAWRFISRMRHGAVSLLARAGERAVSDKPSRSQEYIW